MLLRQKAQTAQEKISSLSDLQNTDDVLSPEKQEILNEIKDLEDKFRVLNNEASELSGQCQSAKKEADEANEALVKLQDEHDKRALDIDKYKQDIEDYKLMIKIAEAKEASEKKKEAYEKIEKQCQANKADLDKLTHESSEKLGSLDEINSKLNDTNANILAIEKILETSYAESSEATKWLDKNREKFGKVKNLSDSIDVPEKYLNLLETLLGNYSSSFLTGTKELKDIKKQIKEANDASGSLRLVVNDNSKYAKEAGDKAEKLAKKFGGVCLSNEVKVNEGDILGVLSNVVVFDNADDAFKASEENIGTCIASLDGTIIYPDGRYLIGGPFYVDSAYDSDSSRTILSYKKNLKKLNKEASDLNKKIDAAQSEVDEIDKKMTKLQQSDIELKNTLATAKAELDFANNYLAELKSGLSNDWSEDDIKSSNVSTYKKKLDKASSEIDQSKEWLSGSSEEIRNARALADTKRAAYNEMVVKEAALKERLNSHEEILGSAKERLSAQEQKENENIEELKLSAKLTKVYSALSQTLDSLSKAAKKDLDKLDESFSSVNQAVSEIQKQSDDAINASNAARKQFDEENQKLSEIQVELGKLEIQVQNAVDAIDNIEGISVDKALEMPDIENRPEKEERQFKLRRRIANMGVINPDAKQEYDVLKERFDFLNGQVDDLRAAKISLSKINAIIEERMKDDFINTFDEVNQNFQEIFAILFPGGRARLELEEPNDLENSGVEVKAQPHGKHISKMSLLSGGEKSLVALCLLFAVYKKRSTPFYILDEVEAALDDTNLRRLIKYLEDLRDSTQLIMITHQRRTMEMANVLYGVSMKNDGVTRVVSQKLEKDDRLHNIDK